MEGSYCEIDGDATKPLLSDPNEIVVMPHCCNSIGAWGAGFTCALDRVFGEGPYQEYKKMESESPNGLKNRLGEICVCDINKEGNIYVVNMIAQQGVRGRNNPKPIKYWALLKCMQQVQELIGQLKSDNIIPGIDDYSRNSVIHTCRFGSDLAGGTWDFIKELIMETWVDRGTDVVIYNYK